jgi:hypothetical protein
MGIITTSPRTETMPSLMTFMRGLESGKAGRSSTDGLQVLSKNAIIYP